MKQVTKRERERERERGGVLLSHFTLDQSTEGDLQQFFDSTKGTCAQSFWFFFFRLAFWVE